MRTDFHRQLGLLNADLAAMCDLAATAIRRATDALLHTDLGAAEHALAGIEQLRRLNLNVDRRTLSLLARQAPVAGDLRAVVSAVQIGADADRMGGLAAHVAAAVRRRHPAPVLPTQIAPRFAEMGRIAASLADAAREVVLDGDPVAAARIRSDDADMDAQHRLLLAALTPRRGATEPRPQSTSSCSHGSTSGSPTTPPRSVAASSSAPPEPTPPTPRPRRPTPSREHLSQLMRS